MRERPSLVLESTSQKFANFLRIKEKTTRHEWLDSGDAASGFSSMAMDQGPIERPLQSANDSLRAYWDRERYDE